MMHALSGVCVFFEVLHLLRCLLSDMKFREASVAAAGFDDAAGATLHRLQRNDVVNEPSSVIV